MGNSSITAETRVAGVVAATCTCCTPAEILAPHVTLGTTRLVCPQTRQTYLDRGDGAYEADGESLAEALPLVEVEVQSGETELLSDRPVRTGPKTRIDLERATFAAIDRRRA